MAARLVLIFTTVQVLFACTPLSSPKVNQDSAVKTQAVITQAVVTHPSQTSTTLSTNHLLLSYSTLKPISRTLLHRVAVLKNNGQYDAANAQLDRALTIEPEHPIIWYELANLRYLQTHFEQSIELARKAQSLESDNKILRIKLWALIAKNYAQLGQPYQAEKALHKASSIN